mmetsp:Transcript_104421/g.265020  ORF Transcript_104421/g.265020 Transcript_104421/m.265020 type:complete len:265 (-) Transcript_104421:74-868(-)
MAPPPRHALAAPLALILAGQLLAGASGEALSANLRSTSSVRRNPLLDNYRKWSRAYEKDAQEAEAAAAKYSYMTQALQTGGSGGSAVSRAVHGEMNRNGAKQLAEAVWAFERTMRDPAPKRAAEAAAKAREPYMKEYVAYRDVGGKYDAAAEQYALLAGKDMQLANELTRFQNQYALEGNQGQANEFKGQAKHLVKQIGGEQKLAKEYHSMAKRIDAALPKIYDMANEAAAYAAYTQNPKGVVADFQLLPFTVAPPLAMPPPWR